MFTGIVSELGAVEAVTATEKGARLRVRAGLSSELRPGDSVAVSGACLTATAAEDGAFEADVMKQTLSLTTLGEREVGDRVNLELPLRPSDRIGGHVVQGHVDGTGKVVMLKPDGIAQRLRVELGDDLIPFAIERGSIAIDGVSLTVAELDDTAIEASLIPETLERTTLGGIGPGQSVNVECDVMARYVRRIVSAMSPLVEETER